MVEKQTELRLEFHRELDEIDQAVVRMFAQVTEGIAMATEALLADDTDLAARVRVQEESIDATQVELEDRLERILLLQQPMASELRYVLSVLRIAPELERSGDLAEHIANRAGRGLSEELTPAMRGTIEQMGAIAVDLWRRAADAFADRDGTAHDALDAADDEIDDLHRALLELLTEADLAAPVASEVTLIGRFYERLGDHAVHIAGRVRYAAGQ
jgi:phosphate transport system protein